MKNVKAIIAIMAILSVIVIGSSLGFDISTLQATSDNGDDVTTFEGDLLPQQSTSNEKVIQFEETQPETIVESDNLHNPSIQNQVNQTPALSQEDVQLQGKEKYDWELPNGEGCKWNDPLPGWPRHWICSDLETALAWHQYNQTFEGGKTKPENTKPLQHLTHNFGDFS
jgi:hypothetical protein